MLKNCMSEFSETLAWWVDQRPDLTPTAIARACGLDKTAVRQIIVNGRTPKIDTAQKICSVLGVTLDQFYSRDLEGKRRHLERLVASLDDDEIKFLQAAAEGMISRRRDSN